MYFKLLLNRIIYDAQEILKAVRKGQINYTNIGDTNHNSERKIENWNAKQHERTGKNSLAKQEIMDIWEPLKRQKFQCVLSWLRGSLHLFTLVFFV